MSPKAIQHERLKRPYTSWPNNPLHVPNLSGGNRVRSREARELICSLFSRPSVQPGHAACLLHIPPEELKSSRCVASREQKRFHSLTWCGFFLFFFFGLIHRRSEAPLWPRSSFFQVSVWSGSQKGHNPHSHGEGFWFRGQPKLSWPLKLQCLFQLFYWYTQKIKLSRSSAWALQESPWARDWSDHAVLQFQVFPGLFKAMRPRHWGLVLENPRFVEKKLFHSLIAPPTEGR